MMADFQNGLISRKFFLFFRKAFCTEQLSLICRMDSDVFVGILIFDRKSDFAWAIAFA